MRVIYPITANYVQTWDPARGLSELVSNMLDGSNEYGEAYSFKYDARKRVVSLTNENTTLSRDALLLGESSKRGGGDSIGQFGEGLKLGCLVLRRERFPVTIKNGRYETWKPEIENVESFGKPVLVMNITKATRQVNHLVVEVEGVEKELWDEVEKRFLALRKNRESIRETDEGDVLTAPDDIGRVYVRGVYICHFKDYTCGYNFKNVRVGRDREIPHTYDIEDNIRDIWSHLVLSRSDEVSLPDVVSIYDLLNSNKPEATALRYVGSRVSSLIAGEFKRRHGDDAIPVVSTAIAVELEHLGAKGVLVEKALEAVVTGYGDVVSSELFKKKTQFDSVKTYHPDELTNEERGILLKLMVTLGAIEETGKDRIKIVDFKNEGVLGRHVGQDKPIEISRKMLKSFGSAMTVAIHELAHDRGPDGSVQHTQGIADLTEKVFNRLAWAS